MSSFDEHGLWNAGTPATPDMVPEHAVASAFLAFLNVGIPARSSSSTGCRLGGM